MPERRKGRLLVVLGALGSAVERVEAEIRRAHPEIERIFLEAAALLPRS